MHGPEKHCKKFGGRAKESAFRAGLCFAVLNTQQSFSEWNPCGQCAQSMKPQGFSDRKRSILDRTRHFDGQEEVPTERPTIFPAVHSCMRSCEMRTVCSESGTNFGRIIQATHSAATTSSFRTFQNSGGPARKDNQDLEKLFAMKLRSCLVVYSPESLLFRELEKISSCLKTAHTCGLTASKWAPSAEPQNLRIRVAKLCGKPGHSSTTLHTSGPKRQEYYISLPATNSGCVRVERLDLERPHV